MSYNKCSVLEKQPNASKKNSVSTSVGNYVALQMLSFSVPPVIQRVPKLEDVAFIQAMHLAKDFFKSQNRNEDYKELMWQIKNHKHIRRYMGLPDIFGTVYQGLSKEDAKLYFENCIRLYYGGSQVSQFDLSHVIPGGGLGGDKEEGLLGRQLNPEGTEFSEDMVKFFPQLKEALQEVIYRPHEPASYRQAKREKRKAEKKGNSQVQEEDTLPNIEKIQNVTTVINQDNENQQLTNEEKPKKDTFKIRSYRFRATQKPDRNSIQQASNEKVPPDLNAPKQSIGSKALRRFGEPQSENFNQPSHQAFSISNVTTASFGEVLKSNIELGTTVANLMFRKRKLPEVHLGYAEGQKLGSFSSHFLGGQEDKISVIDKLRWREGLKIVKGTFIPEGTIIPIKKSPQLMGVLVNKGLDINKKLSIGKGTRIENGVEISSSANPAENNIPDPYLLTTNTWIEDPGVDISFDSAYNDNVANIPQGLVIKKGTFIPLLTMDEQNIPLTTGRTIVHELAHQAESYLGVDEMIRLYRGLYARTIQDPNSILETGITQIGGVDSSYYGLNLFLPDLGLSEKGFAKWQIDLNKQTNMSQKNKYPGSLVVCNNGTNSSQFLESNFYGTEFLSTTAELFTKEDLADRIIETDPLRAALFLSIADPKLYRLIKKMFKRKVGKHGEDIDLDKWLHIDNVSISNLKAK